MTHRGAEYASPAPPAVIFWLTTSRATAFTHQEGDEVVAAGDLWLIRLQEAHREAHIERRRQTKERGLLAVMWPQLFAFLVGLILWVFFIRWYF